jgi:poly(3-hydroxyalkanoate) synthetase
MKRKRKPRKALRLDDVHDRLSRFNKDVLKMHRDLNFLIAAFRELARTQDRSLNKEVAALKMAYKRLESLYSITDQVEDAVAEKQGRTYVRM